MRDLYQDHPHPFGIEPEFCVKKALSVLKPGKVLDIGAGDGRNTLFLAKKGYSVTAVDKLESAISVLVNTAKELNVDKNIKGIVTDIVSLPQDTFYETIISTYVLHFLSKESFFQVLNYMQEQTNTGGLNVISDFTKEGAMYTSHQEKINAYWLAVNELKSLYKDWEILFYEEHPVQTFATDADGNHYTQMSASIIARKK